MTTTSTVQNPMPFHFKGPSSSVNFDFEDIKANLKDYLGKQEEFKDYNFESSGIAVLIDILAYNAHMNALTAHLAMSEMFLSSAQARSNVVALAKQLGYTPRSRSSSKAVVDILLKFTTSKSKTFILPKGSRFSGGGYSWFNTEDIIATQGVNDKQYKFTNVAIVQGVRKQTSHYYDIRMTYPTFSIPHPNIVMDSLRVREYFSDDNNSPYIEYEKFTRFSDLVGIQTDEDLAKAKRPFFVQESPNGLYEVYFSSLDRIKPQFGNRIVLDYITTEGSAANGTGFFTCDTTIETGSEIKQVTALAASSGGNEKENVESIKINASGNFATQDRCVTHQDYVSLIRRDFGDAESISVWGGENMIPPDYGTVFLCIKPMIGQYLSYSQKNHLLDNIIKPKAILTMRHKIVDPIYTYINLSISSKYDSANTTYDQYTLATKINDTVVKYTDEVFEKFDTTFRHSNLLALIDKSEPSILSSQLDVVLVKKLISPADTPIEATLYFSGTKNGKFSPFDKNSSLTLTHDSVDNNDNYLHSAFTITHKGRLCQIVDVDPRKDSEIIGGYRRLILVAQNDDTDKLEVIEDDVGKLFLNEGRVELYNILPEKSITLTLYMLPTHKDLYPERNNLLILNKDALSIKVSPEM